MRFGSRSLAALVALVAGQAVAQYCPVTSTHFSSTYSLAGCTAGIGTCWSVSAFPGSMPISGSQYPSTNYACATPAPVAGALENALYAYDGNGNLTVAKDPLGRSTTNSYDALNRLIQVLDPAAGITRYAYNGNNTLVQVTDPRTLNTVYSPNGFGETEQLSSPDTGITTTTFDAAGRVWTKQDARGTQATYSYDDLGRVILESYTGGGTIGYTYDQGTYGKGRLTTVQDVGTTTFDYEAHGRVVQKTQTVGGVTRMVVYHYDGYGRLDQMTYPSGMVVTLGYANGQVTSLTAAGQSVLAGAVYSPFGAVKSWTWGNGQAYARGIDQDGRVYSYPRNTNTQTLGFDAASRVVSLTDSNNASLNQIFGYDALDRLASDSPGPNGTQATRGYTYDPTGNRLTATVSGVTTTYTTPATSNRLDHTSGGAVYAYDAMGNVTGDGTRTFGYNARGRMNSAIVSGQTTTYAINAFGQRVRKVTPTATTVFVYDEAGQLIGEYDGSGNLLAEHIYLNGMPIAVVKLVAGNPKVYQVYPDHLGAPRAVVDPAVAQPVWQWHNVDPFGGNLPNENPAQLGNFKYGLRFPGQYYDAETQLHYNYFRDYDPVIGRYFESDPIGITGLLERSGQILTAGPDAQQLALQFADIDLRFAASLHLYANGSPAANADFFGLAPAPPRPPGKPPTLPPLPEPPRGTPGVPLPQPLPPMLPGRPSCEQAFKLCLGACLPRCPGPPIVRGTLCGALCVSVWLACKFGGGEH
jgi:RHS repeat-associated protein